MSDKELFKRVRLKLEMNQSEIGNAIKLSRSGIASIESGQNNVTSQTKLILQLLYNVNPEYWEGAEEMFLPDEKTESYIDSGIIKAKDETINALNGIIEIQQHRIGDLEIFRDMVKAQLPAKS